MIAYRPKHSPISHQLSAISLLLCGLSGLHAVELDREAVQDPRRIDLIDNASTTRWERLFTPDQNWIGRDLSVVELRNPHIATTALAARLLYRGEPWSRRLFAGNSERWHDADREVRLAVLRNLRYRHEAGLGDVYCAFLAQESQPKLALSALTNLTLLDAPSAILWATRMADPRHAKPLPASQDVEARCGARALLVEMRGADDDLVRPALTWALLNAEGAELHHALRLIPRGSVPDLLRAVILRFAGPFRTGSIDDAGRFALVLAATRITGTADRALLDTLMLLTVKGDRSLAAAAATALGSGVTWDIAIAINDLAERAGSDPDPVIRQTLMALLVRLDPSAVPTAAGPTSPWSKLAEHAARLDAWEAERTTKPEP
jgi:hypothetical protein